jgi:hypothetical protein
MRFTPVSARWRRQTERKKRLIEILGGKVAATHSTGEVPMRHAVRKDARASLTSTNAPLETTDNFQDKNLARFAYRRRKATR